MLAACDGPLSTLDVAGPAAGSLARLWWAMFFGATGLFLLTMALLYLAVAHPAIARRVSSRGWMLWGGFVLPALVLPPLTGYALLQGDRLLTHRGTGVAQIEVEAFAFGWTFRYPDHGGAVTSNVLHLPAGVPVDMVITSLDVIHSFWIPRVAGKLDAVPGHVNVLRIEASEAGPLHGQCMEFCGVGHAFMVFAVEVHAAEDFEAALAAAALP